MLDVKYKLLQIKTQFESSFVDFIIHSSPVNQYHAANRRGEPISVNVY